MAAYLVCCVIFVLGRCVMFCVQRGVVMSGREEREKWGYGVMLGVVLGDVVLAARVLGGVRVGEFDVVCSRVCFG